MTTSNSNSYIAALCCALLIASTGIVQASEVTGTLSSDATTVHTATTTGSLAGTVISESTGGGSSSSGGSRRSTGGSSLSTPPASTVLGAATSNPAAPGFPNAGAAQESSVTENTLWSAMMNFFRTLFSF